MKIIDFFNFERSQYNVFDFSLFDECLYVVLPFFSEKILRVGKLSVQGNEAGIH